MSFRSGARLRLRPPRALRRRPRLPRPAALLLVVLLIGALGAAYRFYLDGIPGSPQLPTWEGATEANSSGDAMVILGPPGVVIRQRVLLGQVDARHDSPVRVFNEPDPMLKLDPGTIQVSVDFQRYEPGPFDLVLELTSGARVARNGGIRAFSRDGDTPPVIVDGPYSLWELVGGAPDRPPPSDTDYIVLHVNPPPAKVRENGETSLYKLEFELLLRPLWPFAVRDNARVVLRTPSFRGFMQCDDINALVRYFREQGPRFPSIGACRRPEPPDASATTVLLDVERAEWKTDLLHPAPAEGDRDDATGGVTWWTSSGPVRITGNYVNINAEAAGQRLLFLSGLLAGFALGLVPVAVEKLRFPRGRTVARGRGSRSRRS